MAFMCGYARALSQHDISRTSRPTTWFNSHAFLSRLPSCVLPLWSRLFSPPFPVLLFLPPYLHLARLRRRSYPFLLGVAAKAKLGPTIFAKPWPTEEPLSGRLFGDINDEPQVSKYECSPELLAYYFPQWRKALADRPCHQTLKKEEPETPLAPQFRPLRNDFACRLSVGFVREVTYSASCKTFASDMLYRENIVKITKVI